MQDQNSKSDNVIIDLTGKLKSSLNSIFHTILNDLHISLWQAVLIMLIEYVQSLYFIFYRSNDFSWDFDSPESVIRLVSKITLVWPYAAENSTSILFMIYHLCGALVVGTFAVFIILIVVTIKRKSLILVTILWFIGIIITLLQTVLFLPLISNFIYNLALYLLLISCTDGTSIIIPNYECWTAEHYIHVSFGAFYLFILLALVLPSVGIYFENYSGSDNVLKKISSTADMVDILFKILMTLSLIIFHDVRIKIIYSLKTVSQIHTSH